MYTSQHFYIIVPEKTEYIKIGRWNARIENLAPRYVTPYGKFDIYVFQCEDSTKVENGAFEYLREFKWSGELYDKKALPDALAYATRTCLSYVDAHDLLLRIEVSRKRREQRAELDALRNSLKNDVKPKRNGKADPSAHARKVVDLILENVILAQVNRQIDQIEKQKFEHERVSNLQADIAQWVKKHVRDVTGDTDPDTFLSRRKLYDLYKNATPNERERKTRIGERTFFQIVKGILGDPQDRYNYMEGGKEVHVYSCWSHLMYI